MTCSMFAVRKKKQHIKKQNKTKHLVDRLRSLDTNYDVPDIFNGWKSWTGFPSDKIYSKNVEIEIFWTVHCVYLLK